MIRIFLAFWAGALVGVGIMSFMFVAKEADKHIEGDSDDL